MCALYYRTVLHLLLYYRCCVAIREIYLSQLGMAKVDKAEQKQLGESLRETKELNHGLRPVKTKVT